MDRETTIEVIAAIVPLLVMVAVMVAIGSMYLEDNGTLTPTGGQALIGAITAFVLLMAAIGIYLSRSGFKEGEPNGS